MLAPSRERSRSHKRQVFNRLGSEEYVSLKGKKGLIVGIANRNSIAYGCAEVLRGAGAELAVTYLNAKAEPFVRPLAEQLGSPIMVPCDVREPRSTRGSVLAHPEGMGPSRFPAPLDCLRAEGRSAQPYYRLLPSRVRNGDGRIVPLFHPDGAVGGASHDGRWMSVDGDFLRLGKGRGRVQPDGAGEGCA